MLSIILRSSPSFIHLVLTIIYFEVMLDTYEDNFGFIVTTGLCILITINSVMTTFVSRGQWRQLLISVISFILSLFIYMMYLVLTGDPSREVDDNPAEGILLLVLGLPLSFISILFGTLIGITVIKLKKQVKEFYKEPDGKNV